MKGTVHESDWIFYHDALSILTSIGTREYIKSKEYTGKTIFDKWFLPQNNLNAGTPYHGRPVGNSPEFMPLDNSLNYDLQVSHRHHCAVTAHLPEGDPRKHSLSTPRRITVGLKKIWEHPHGAPSPNRVVQDVYLTFEAHSIVYKANGKMVPGLTNRNGHQRNADGSKQWGRVHELNHMMFWKIPGSSLGLKRS